MLCSTGLFAARMTTETQPVDTLHPFGGVLQVDSRLGMARAAIGCFGIALRMAGCAVACRAAVSLRKSMLPDIDLLPALLAMAPCAVGAVAAFVSRRGRVAVAARICESGEALRAVTLDTLDVGMLPDKLDRMIEGVLCPCRFRRVTLSTQE